MSDGSDLLNSKLNVIDLLLSFLIVIFFFFFLYKLCKIMICHSSIDVGFPIVCRDKFILFQRGHVFDTTLFQMEAFSRF